MSMSRRWRHNRRLWETGHHGRPVVRPLENRYVIRVYLYGGRASEHELA
jgi:hypothetical protein